MKRWLPGHFGIIGAILVVSVIVVYLAFRNIPPTMWL